MLKPWKCARVTQPLIDPYEGTNNPWNTLYWYIYIWKEKDTYIGAGSSDNHIFGTVSQSSKIFSIMPTSAISEHKRWDQSKRKK